MSQVREGRLSILTGTRGENYEEKLECDGNEGLNSIKA